MSRTLLYKGFYFLLLGIWLAIALAALRYVRFSSLAFVPVLAAMLLPGRVLAFYWRDLLRGLRCLNARDYAAAKRHSAAFLAEVRARPWIKHLVWLGSSCYSRNAEVLALSNLGGAETMLGEADAAREHLEAAIRLDGLCPLPFYNLGVLARDAGQAEEAQRCFAEARRLGLRWGISDRILLASQARFARSAPPP